MQPGVEELHGPGAYFGAEALAFGVMRRDASVQVIEECRVWTLRSDDLTDLEVDLLEFKAHALHQSLKDVPYFRGLSQSSCRLLAQIINIRYYDGDNTPVIRQSDHSDAFYVLLEGRVRVYLAKQHPGEASGGDHFIKYISSDTEAPWFGESAFILPAATPRTATIACVEPCKVMAVQGADNLKRFLTYTPRFGEMLRTTAKSFQVIDQLRRGDAVDTGSFRRRRKQKSEGVKDVKADELLGATVNIVKFAMNLKKKALEPPRESENNVTRDSMSEIKEKAAKHLDDARAKAQELAAEGGKANSDSPRKKRTSVAA